eukprot:Gb_18487 [translate_table: standard]
MEINCRPGKLLCLLLTMFIITQPWSYADVGLYVFGDSYADTGNRDPYNITQNKVWRSPYGFTWPAYPAGRFSSGRVQTDLWAEMLDLPSPVPYQQLRTFECGNYERRIKKGVNFAEGGAAVFEAFGNTKLGPWFQGMLALVKPVVEGISQSIIELHKMGLSNIAVSTIMSFCYVPAFDKKSCQLQGINETVEFHNRLLAESVQHLRRKLKGSSIIILDFQAAFSQIFTNLTAHGKPLIFSCSWLNGVEALNCPSGGCTSRANFSFNLDQNLGFDEILEPCCGSPEDATACSLQDTRGRPLYQVCLNPEKRLFWDGYHPTQKGWDRIVSLYSYNHSFIHGASNVVEWLRSLGFLAKTHPSSSTGLSRQVNNINRCLEVHTFETRHKVNRLESRPLESILRRHFKGITSAAKFYQMLARSRICCAICVVGLFMFLDFPSLVEGHCYPCIE